MLPVVPDPDERNALVWGAWNAARGQLLEETVAQQKFSADRFDRSNGHCVFVEHETVGSDGQPKKYGLRELAKIVRQHSREARDIGAFPALAAHHTPAKDDPNGKEPPVLGYSGNHRLGMIGRENPRWAIFNDEFRLPGASVELSRKPYRSVELWTFKDGRMRFHPIAAVGADAPRLQMPAKYSGKFELLSHEGAVVEKYTVAAYAGGSNTFVKGPVKHTANEGKTMAADPQLLSDIMAAIAETPQFKFLGRMMEEYEAEKALAAQPAPGAVPGAGAPAVPAAPASPEPTAPAPAKPADDLADLSDLLGPDNSPSSPPAKPGEPEKNTVSTTNPNVVSIEKYRALEGSHQNLIKLHGQQNERVQALERRATDADRRQKLSDLAGKYPVFVDAAEEGKACLYSEGANMSDDAFNSHVATIEKYAERMASVPSIPRGALPASLAQSEVDKYEQKLSEEAIKIHGEALKQGRVMDYSTAEAEAKKRLGK